VALGVEDVDYDEMMLHVRRQLKRLGGTGHVYGLPKNDHERDVPLPAWGAAAIRAHLAAHSAWPCTLPWEKLNGKPETHSLLYRWPDGSFVRYRSYSEQVWKPALVAAGIIGEPVTDKRVRRRYETVRKEGPHQLRHFYASVMLHGGVSVKELAEYLGHRHALVTLQVYSHLIAGSHDRARQVFDSAMFKPRAVS
jgi:integrase